MPQVSAVGIRVVGAGLGANGSELRAFNEHPGTAVALAIQPPAGTGIVGIEDRGSKLDAFTDDKGQSLLEEGRIGPFPKIAEDGSSALVEVEVQARPSAGAATVTAQGSVSMSLSSGSKPTRVPNVKLEPKAVMKVGTATITINDAKADDDSTHLTLGLTRAVMTTIRTIKFFDAKGAAIESQRNSSGYMNNQAEMEYSVKTKDKVVAVEFDIWQNLRTVSVPFNVTAGLGLAPGGRPAPATDASSGGRSEMRAAPAANRPPPVITAADGAASVEAVVKQMQSAVVAKKPAALLSVIYPDDRSQYTQMVAMALAFQPLSKMDDPKAAEKVQKDVDDLLAKHKIKAPLSRDPDELLKDTDQTAFLTDAMTYFRSTVKKGDDPASSFPVPPGKPQEVKITGDSAVAQMDGKDVKFTRIGTKWFIRLE
jgi:hypothetical protein